MIAYAGTYSSTYACTYGTRTTTPRPLPLKNRSSALPSKFKKSSSSIAPKKGHPDNPQAGPHPSERVFK